MQKYLNNLLDVLLFVIPLLDLLILPVMSSGEATMFIPPEYMGYYMLAVVILRRVARLVEGLIESRKADGGSDVA
jgi:hypothetical protein